MTDQGKTLVSMSAMIAAGLSANPANTGLSAASLSVEAWNIALCLYQLGDMHRDKSFSDAGKAKADSALCTATL